MPVDETISFARALGRLEATTTAIASDVAEIKRQNSERDSRKWQTWAALATGFITTVSSGIMLFHFGIK